MTEPNASPNPADLAAALQSDDWGDRIRAINGMRNLEGDVALPLLSTAAVDKNARVRYAAISQIGTLELSNPKQPLDLLRDRLENDSEVDVRGAAAAALGDLQQPEVLADLLAAVEREDEWLVQLSIVSALGILGEKGAFETVLKLSQDDNSLIRATAAGALGDLADERGASRLLELAKDDDWQVRHRSAIAMSTLQTAETKAALQTLSEDSEEQVALTAREVLKLLA